MNSISFVFVVALVVGICSASIQLPNPKISCNFTAEIIYDVYTHDPERKFREEYNEHYSYHYMHYSIDTPSFQAYKQVGNISDYSLGEATAIIVPPNHYHLITPFLDRKTCVVLPIRAGQHCFSVDFDAQTRDVGVRCLTDKTRHCNVFYFVDVYEFDELYYVYNDSTPENPILDTVVVYADSYDEYYHFLSFKPQLLDKSTFAPDKTQPCTNLVPDHANSNPSYTSEAVLSNPASYSLFAPPRRSNMKPLSREAARASSRKVNDPSRLEELTRSVGGKWKVVANRAFDGMTIGEVTQTLLKPATPAKPTGERILHHQNVRVLPAEDIPASFDSREQWPLCGIGNIRDQGSCGSCWAFGAAESFSDRYCIHGNKKEPIVMSPQYLVSCFKNLDACEGGYVDVAWTDLKRWGITTDDCVPYKARNTTCPTTCADGSKMKIYRSNAPYSPYVAFNQKKTVAAIQTEILTNGPLEAAFWVFDDFMNYGGGVYEHNQGGSFQGGHAIKIIGWGHDDIEDEDYWTVVNSWGEDWGEKGTFRIVRGTNECGIEDEAVAGIPVV